MSSFFRRSATRFEPPFSSDHADAAAPTLESVQRELALFQAEALGAQTHVGEFGSSPGLFSLSRKKRRELRDLVDGSTEPSLLIDPRAGLHIVDANKAFAEATLTDCGRIAGERLFTALPGNPDDESVAIAFHAYKTCAQTRRQYLLPVQHYAIIDQAGVVRQRRWRSSYHPFLDDSGRLAYIMNRLVRLSAD